MPYQIIYSSEAATPMQAEDLKEILDKARPSNASKGITGALVYADGVFLQILEGDRIPVQALMARIRGDLRHESVIVLREGEVATATFAGWKMAYVSATPQQVAEWAGLRVAAATSASTAETLRQVGEEKDRTAQFAQDILALLAAEHSHKGDLA